MQHSNSHADTESTSSLFVLQLQLRVHAFELILLKEHEKREKTLSVHEAGKNESSVYMEYYESSLYGRNSVPLLLSKAKLITCNEKQK